MRKEFGESHYIGYCSRSPHGRGKLRRECRTFDRAGNAVRRGTRRLHPVPDSRHRSDVARERAGVLRGTESFRRRTEGKLRFTSAAAPMVAAPGLRRSRSRTWGSVCRAIRICHRGSRPRTSADQRSKPSTTRLPLLAGMEPSTCCTAWSTCVAFTFAATTMGSPGRSRWRSPRHSKHSGQQSTGRRWRPGRDMRSNCRADGWWFRSGCRTMTRA